MIYKSEHELKKAGRGLYEMAMQDDSKEPEDKDLGDIKLWIFILYIKYIK